MPKRSHKNDSDYLRRKLRKIQQRLALCDNEEAVSPNSNSSVDVSPIYLDPDPEHEEDIQESIEVEIVPTQVDKTQPGPSTSVAESVIPDVPSAEVLTETEPPDLDEEILNLLGETPMKDKKYGPEIRSELAVRWEYITTSGLTKDSRKELLEKHPVPKNCLKIDTPKLNPEIKAALSEWLIKKDKALENKQKQIAASITCISEALTRLFSLEHKDQTVIRLLIEAGRLLCDTQCNESMTRRSFICSSIKKDIKDQLYNTEIDSFLFGEKLADTLKAAKAISKSGAEMKIIPPKEPPRKTNLAQRPKTTAAQALNQRAPLPTARQTGAARRYESSQTTTPRSRQPQPQRQPQRSQHQPPSRR